MIIHRETISDLLWGSLSRLLFVSICLLYLRCNVGRLDLGNQGMENLIVCHLELEKDSVLVNGNVLLSFVIRNNSNQIIYTNNSPYDYYLYGVKAQGFNIEVENENGDTIQPKDAISMHSGRFGIVEIRPNENLKINVHNFYKYGITDNEGKYNISVERELIFYMQQKKKIKGAPTTSEEFKSSLKVSKSLSTNLHVLKSRE
jgi:hypothetical protein